MDGGEGFVGRMTELETLESAFQGEASACVPVYGRRRVGKSELLLRFMGAHPGIYYLGKRGQAGLQVREFLEVAARALNEPLMASWATAGWGEALRTVVERWTGPGKLVLALDEFQWIVEASPELPSVLQGLWDRTWSKSGRVMLVLCGSYVGFMEREVLGRRSPLFGRRTAQILLRPFNFLEARLFHPGYSVVDLARTYFVCGGIPLYLKFFSRNCSVETNIGANLLDEHAPLFMEPEFLLREELREVDNYYAILLALASGSLPSREISRATSLGDRSLPYYLGQLVELGYVRRRYPLTGARPVTRHVRYEMDDPLLRFWFRFVYPHTSLIARLGPRRSLQEIVRPQLQAYLGSCFERLCREALPLLHEKEGIAVSSEVGEYWDSKTQIDVVGLRDDGWTDLGECRWGAVRSARALEAELSEKAGRFPNPRGATLCLRAFTCKRPARASPGVKWHSLEDLYRLRGTRV